MNPSCTNADVWNSCTPDLIGVQIEGKIAFINPVGAKMLGAASPEQLAGKPILDFVHPDYRAVARERITQLMNEGVDVYPVEEKWLRLDGTVIDVEVATMRLFYQGKPGIGFIVRERCESKLHRPAQHRYARGELWRRRLRRHS